MPQQDERTAYVEEFPFLEQLPMRVPFRVSLPDMDLVTVRVQRADASLMYRRHINVFDQPMPIGGRTNPYSQAAWQVERFFVVDGGRLYDMESPRPPRDAFRDHDFESVEYMVWLRIQSIFDGSHMAHGPTGKNQIHAQRAYITIFKPPTDGWAELYRTARLSDSVLTDRRIREGCEQRDPEWLAIKLRLQALACEFAAGPYNWGLRDQIMAAYNDGELGMKGEFASIQLRSYVLAECIWINISSANHQVTFVGFTDEKDHAEEGLRWGGVNAWKGIYASVPWVEQTLSVAKSAWPVPSFKPSDIRGPF